MGLNQWLILSHNARARLKKQRGKTTQKAVAATKSHVGLRCPAIIGTRYAVVAIAAVAA